MKMRLGKDRISEIGAGQVGLLEMRVLTRPGPDSDAAPTPTRWSRGRVLAAGRAVITDAGDAHRAEGRDHRLIPSARVTGLLPQKSHPVRRSA